MTTSEPIRLKIDMNEKSKGDAGFQWPEEQRKYWIVAMFCGTLLLYAARSAVPLCMAAMSSELKWDKEIDVSPAVSMSRTVYLSGCIKLFSLNKLLVSRLICLPKNSREKSQQLMARNGLNFTEKKMEKVASD